MSRKHCPQGKWLHALRQEGKCCKQCWRIGEAVSFKTEVALICSAWGNNWASLQQIMPCY
eukprot:1161125-Pelagomonas_calceolata.AAC.13